jgi:polysaccharide export outer membrane protein
MAGLLLTGCHSPQPVFMDPNAMPTVAASMPGTQFRVGDMVIVTFSGVTSPPEVLPHAERVGDDGTISLPHIGKVPAVAKTPGQLQNEIHDAYVPKFYAQLTVTVRGEARMFYIDGEVKAPGPREYPGDMTIVKAISAAGGFTDFAKRWKVRLTRSDGHTQNVNVDKAIKNPELDVPVYPGDKIFVPRRIF